ncbi:MAG: succinate dehydrogenase, partial [Chloroflexota bacterium]
MRISTGYGSRPVSGGFETFTWYFMRISAIGLVFLAIIHLILNHVTTDVACTSYQLVAIRYANPYWRVYDWLLLTLALLHGMNGLRVVIDDYVQSTAW